MIKGNDLSAEEKRKFWTVVENPQTCNNWRENKCNTCVLHCSKYFCQGQTQMNTKIDLVIKVLGNQKVFYIIIGILQCRV